MSNYDPKQDIFYKLFKMTLQLYKVVGVLLIAGAFVVLIGSNIPGIEYLIDPAANKVEAETLKKSLSDIQISKSENRAAGSYKLAKALPAIDPSLPTVPTIRIPKLGVDGEINLGLDEGLLDKGIWSNSVNSSPTSDLPMVISSHRYGLLSWSDSFRQKNWFYRLNELKSGDEIIIVWGQRPFRYIVSRTTEGKGSVNLSEDLLLFTCKRIRSEDRILVFANKAW